MKCNKYTHIYKAQHEKRDTEQKPKSAKQIDIDTYTQLVQRREKNMNVCTAE